MRRRLVAAVPIIVAFALACPFGALAQFGGTQIVFDPQMFVRQLQQLQQETTTVTDLAQQLRYMALNTTPYLGGVWQPNTILLGNLGNMVATEQGLSYALTNLPTEFAQLFPGYTAPAGVSAVTAQQAGQGFNNTLATLSGTLVSLQGQAQDFAAENSALQTLSTANATATGRLEAIQIGNQIALLQVQQAQMLRQTMLTLTNALAVTQANQVSIQAQGIAAVQQFYGPTVPAPQPESPETFGLTKNIP
jgi:P-type conjugative transfer protein TrbJ